MLFVALIKLAVPFFGAATSCSNSFFFLPSWWQYLPTQPTPPDCEITFNFPTDIWAVGLSVLEMLLRVSGLVAIVSLIIAGIAYITASGNPEKAASSRRRIYNSLIGLAIVSIAALLVGFIGDSLGG